MARSSLVSWFGNECIEMTLEATRLTRSDVTLHPVLTDVEKASIVRSVSRSPSDTSGLSDDADGSRGSRAAKAELGERLVILGHHYQRDEVIKFADYIGDSFKLARRRRSHARRPSSSSSAACTSWPRAPTSSRAPHQQVILPDLAAGCSMADMADARSARDVLARARADGRRCGAASQSSRSPTSTRRPRDQSVRAASTAASSARRRTPAAAHEVGVGARRADA